MLFTTLLRQEVSPIEQRRQNTLTGNLCPMCGCRLTIGEVEATEICTTCYFDVMADDEEANH